MEPMTKLNGNLNDYMNSDVTDVLHESSFRDENSICQADQKDNVKQETECHSSNLMTELTSICQYDTSTPRNYVPGSTAEVVELKEEVFYCQHCPLSDISLHKLKIHMLNQHPMKAAVILNSLVEKSHNSASDVTFLCVRESCNHFTSICYIYEDHLMSCCSPHTNISETEKKRLEVSVKFLLVFHRNHGFKIALGFVEFVTTFSKALVSSSTFKSHELSKVKLFNDNVDSLVHGTILQKICGRDAQAGTSCSSGSIHNVVPMPNTFSTDPLRDTLSSQSNVVYENEDQSFYITENKDINLSPTSNAIECEVTSESQSRVCEVDQDESQHGNDIKMVLSESVEQTASTLPAFHGREQPRVLPENHPKSEFPVEGDSQQHVQHGFNCDTEEILDGQAKKLQGRRCSAENPHQQNMPTQLDTDGNNSQSHTIQDMTDEACQFNFSPGYSGLDKCMAAKAGERPYRCGKCGEGFNQERSLDRHMRIHTKEKLYKCNECEESFNQSSHLHKHMGKHSGEMPYKCDECGKMFNQRSHLNRHMRRHRGEKPSVCDVCGKMFSCNSHLDNHKRTHTGEKPYKCNECGKSFSERSSVRKHMRIHTGEKPHKCNECGKTFNQRGNFDRHMRAHVGAQPYKCNMCGKTFSESSSVTRHMRIHTGERPYKCNECSKRFRFSGGLRIHMRKHTG